VWVAGVYHASKGPLREGSEQAIQNAIGCNRGRVFQKEEIVYQMIFELRRRNKKSEPMPYMLTMESIHSR
jgi:hypothetical protein